MTLIQRYLRRVGAGSRAGTGDPVSVLDDLLRRHAAAIPFENLDPLAGHGVDISPEAVAAKLLDARRGGYCHEHALLSQQVLRALGFSCTGALARVYRDPELTTPPGKTHHVTLVDVNGEFRLFDPGFGGGTPNRTVPVREGARVGDYRMVVADEVLPEQLRAPDVQLMLQRRSSEGVWHNFYGFTMEPALPADIALSNWFVSTNPGVMFTRFPVLARTGTDGTRASLSARKLRTVSSVGENVEEIAGRGRFGAVVHEVFGIDAPEGLLDIAWEKSGK